MADKNPVVRYLDGSETIPCPYGNTTRIVTGGEGGVANVHLVRVSDGTSHSHSGYDEVYYVLSGTGVVSIDGEDYDLRPGAVAVIPAGLDHNISADKGKELEFIIFGTPAMSVDDDRFTPRATFH